MVSALKNKVSITWQGQQSKRDQNSDDDTKIEKYVCFPTWQELVQL